MDYMQILKNSVLGLRFLIEVGIVVGLLYGAFQQTSLRSKIFFILLAVIIIVVWSQFGAPKSKYALIGMHKLVLELSVYCIACISFYYLYTFRTASIIGIIIFTDLALMYALHLQGH